MIKQAVKVLGVGIIMACYTTESLLIGLSTRNIWKKRKWRAQTIARWCRRTNRLLGIEVSVDRDIDKNINYLIVSNHMSYIDILVLSSVMPSNFVTSIEIRNTPVLGQLCELGGSLYVERRNKSNLEKEIEDLTNGLKEGLNIFIFPEGTSTNGEEILRFRRPLYNSAIFAHKPVLPVTLNYTKIDGEPFSKSNRDKVCWYGDMSFLPHLWELAGCKKVEAHIVPHMPIELAGSEDPTTLANTSRDIVANSFVTAK
jgi:1-acyl-sn-glycerol-3-phosphate acyltransferase